MANQEHSELLDQGTMVWNRWRQAHPEIYPDLSDAFLRGADLSGADLSDADLSDADLSGADLSDATLSRADLSDATLKGAILSGADLSRATLSRAILSRVTLSSADLSSAILNSADLSDADLSGANLSGANLLGATLRGATLSDAILSDAILLGANLLEATLKGADLSDADLSDATLIGATLSDAILMGVDLSRADLSRADLSGADLSGADLSRADLSGADLSGADLSRATFVETNLTEVTLTACKIYGIAAWNVELKGASQNDLIITNDNEPVITVDNLKIAQFIYLLLNNAEIRDVIDAIGRKAVLILGRFTPKRKVILDALKDALRTQGYLPILFDFEKPSSQDLTETVSTLAHLSRFIIADLTDPSSAPYEVGTIASNHIRPLQALFHPSKSAKRIFAMYPDLMRRYPWVLPPFEYRDLEHLLAALQTHVIRPAEQKAQELEGQ